LRVAAVRVVAESARDWDSSAKTPSSRVNLPPGGTSWWKEGSVEALHPERQ